jgi:hypothetical protein
MEVPQGFVHTVNNLHMGLNRNQPNDRGGFVIFADEGATMIGDDGSLVLKFGTSGYGQYSLISFGPRALMQLATAFAKNTKHLRERFKPVAVTLKPLLEGAEAVTLDAAQSFALSGDEIVISAEGVEIRRLPAAEYEVEWLTADQVR